jgi:hypothetical protein
MVAFLPQDRQVRQSTCAHKRLLTILWQIRYDKVREMNMDQETYSAEAVGKRLGVGAAKVRGWIETGQLQAINVAARPNGIRPRYRIPKTALDEFEARRSTLNV